MDQVIHDTFVVERSYPVAPARLFAAFADPAKKRRWFAEGPAHDLEAYEMDFRVGGREHASYVFRPGTPIAGKRIENDQTYLSIAPERRIVTVQSMSLDGALISTALITIELAPQGEGSQLTCTHQAVFFEGADGPAMREGGWRALFESLAGAVA